MQILSIKINKWLLALSLAVLTNCAWGQKDSDFLIKKRLADIFFQKEKYNLSIQNYAIAASIDPSCNECFQKISEAKKKIKLYFENLKKKEVSSQNNKSTTLVVVNIDSKTESLKPQIPELISIKYNYTTDDKEISSFAIGKFEVTQKEWEIYCKLNKLPFPQLPPNLRNDNYPIINITWSEAKKYVEWLSSATNLHFDLPNKIEWDLARSFSKDLKKEAWIFDNSQKMLHEVGKKESNPLCIYDIEGNVSEWLDDWFDKEFIAEKEIGSFFEDNENFKNRIVCGCSFKDELFLCKNGFTRSLDPEIKKDYIGFRVVKRNF